jgi:hypothetical protein
VILAGPFSHKHRRKFHMGKLIIGLVIGLVAGAGGALLLGGGALTGIGVATGLSAGICSTIEAAQDIGVMTAEQADAVLTAAAEKLSGTDSVEGGDVVGVAAECEQVMQSLTEAAD